MPIQSRIQDNQDRVRERMNEAAGRSGRSVDEVRLVAVCKYVGLPEVRALVDGGCGDLGESRPQVLWEKAAGLDRTVRWHLVGHLQRNKVQRTLPLVAMIHSVDSLRLLRAINDAATESSAGELGPRVPLLLEINTSGDETKHGWPADEIRSVIPQLEDYAGVDVRGLMTMASRRGGLEAARRSFSQLRTLRDHLQKECPSGIELRELSMGMSGDFEVAIEEGSTMVRVGSALFEGC